MTDQPDRSLFVRFKVLLSVNLEGSVAFDVEKKDVSLDLVVTPDVDLWHGQADEEVASVQFRLNVVCHEAGETFDCHL
jgi:hypothetical protein